MRESKVEERLRVGLESKGFKVLKLTTPGHNGTPDRLILRPTWAPGPPWCVELKAPKKHEARLQELIREDWRTRGVLVLDMIDTYEKVDALIEELNGMCLKDSTKHLHCDFCGVVRSSARSLLCAPPFAVREHEWTGKHPADAFSTLDL